MTLISSEVRVNAFGEVCWTFASRYKLREPIQGSSDTTAALNTDLGFNSYSTFTGKFDRKFTHKNHFYIAGSNYNHSKQQILAPTVAFQEARPSTRERA
jgi:hypothetical protein